MKIAIIDDYQDAVRNLDCFKLLAGHDVAIYNDMEDDVDRLANRLAQTEVLVLARDRTRIDEALLSKLPKLKLISQTSRPGAHIDVAACSARGIPVLASLGSSPAPAELAWTLILAAQRRLPQYVANFKKGIWQQSGFTAPSYPPNFRIGRVLHGQTLGIWGLGRIGKTVAGYGKAFGMRVLVHGREQSLTAARAAGYEVTESRQTLFEQSDVLSIHMRLTDQTRGIVTLADLSRMKDDALFVNISRADLVESGALVSALKQGRPGMAALDVYEQEPVKSGDPLLELENALCAPHIGWVELGNYELYFGGAFQTIVDYLSGKTDSVVNLRELAKK